MNGRSASSVGDSWVMRPVAFGVQYASAEPIGTYTNPRRETGAAALAAAADSAGTIASRNGSATVAPSPRRNVRLGNDILEINMSAPVNEWPPTALPAPFLLIFWT